MVLIHGLQNSVMDVKKRKIDFYKDVLDVVKNLNKNKNGNVFILCQTGSKIINYSSIILKSIL